MMDITIESIENGAEYENKIFDFWICGRLSSGLVINVFDFTPFDLRKRIGQRVECLIVAGFIKNITINNSNDQLITGEFIGEYNISSDWLNTAKIVNDEGNWGGIKTRDGIILVSSQELEGSNISIGEMVNFDVGRFDLVGIK